KGSPRTMTIWYCAVLGYMMSLNIYSSFRMISISSTTARDMLCSPPPQRALTLGSNNIGRTKTPKMSASPTTTKAPCSLQQWIYTYLRKAMGTNAWTTRSMPYGHGIAAHAYKHGVAETDQAGKSKHDIERTCSQIVDKHA